jgi:uncharacterized membrane protein
VATLTVWQFTTPYGAEQAEDTLLELQKQELIKVHDAATVSWEQGRKKPKTRQLKDLTGSAALGGAFWGLLFGLIFFVPLLGVAIGAGMGAMVGSMSDVGIDDEFIKEVRDQVTPGTSALFVLTSDAVQDKVRDAFAGLRPQLISTNLTNEQEQALRAAFAEE